MGLFDENPKKEFGRADLRNILKKDDGRIPGTAGRKIGDEKARVKRVEEAFGNDYASRYGRGIDRKDFGKMVKTLDKTRKAAKSMGEKKAIQDEINYWKKIGGI